MPDPTDEIHLLLSAYFDAIYYGDTKLFSRIFHPRARLVCAAADDFAVMEVDEYLKIVAGRQSPAARGDRRADEIERITIASPTTAHARVRELLLPKHFIDDLTLIRVDGHWQIISKVWNFDLVTSAQSRKRLSSSAAILDAFVARSWRSNAQRQLDNGIDFVIGRRDGFYLWNLEGDKRIIDCGTGGGVHSLGHRNPEVLDALRGALDGGLDTGLWSMPNTEYLRLQDALEQSAPHPALNRSVITLCSTTSVDVATMFAFRFTGRQRLLAYRHGYHGHSGFAALATGSAEEGILSYYNLPADHSQFFENYGDLAEVDKLLTSDIGALIMEPMDYETFEPASKDFFEGVSSLCKKRAIPFIVDETRTGLGRTGRLWASEYYTIEPDMLITGKGLSGGLYPASALLLREDIYDKCMNKHPFAYISSLGGNEISCIVANRVLEVASRPQFLEHVRVMSQSLWKRLNLVCAKHAGLLSPGSSFGGILTVTLSDKMLGRKLYHAMYEQGVLCHSVSTIEPTALKFLPPLTLDDEGAIAIAEALDLAASSITEAASAR